jgi:tetratricopeptide (TPR) repeat protein
MDKHDDPKVHELLSLAMFALGDYRGAAIEAHAVLYFGRPGDWATIYGYYGGAAKYTEHLRALEKSVGEKPESPAETFLLGYHYLMLGHQDAAIKMLRKAVELAPQDLPAKKLLYPLEGKPAPQSPSDRGRGKPDTDSGEAKGLP